jgi:hypothetical protein
MTLVLSELSAMGIAMATDSAVTYTDPSTGHSWAVPSAAAKLHTVPSLNAGVACWGLGTIDGTPTDQWLAAFILAGSFSDLTNLAEGLATELNKVVGPSADGAPRAGFHVAGYLDDGQGRVPSLFHVHDGPSEAMEARGISVDPTRFNANHDIPPSRFRVGRSQGAAIIVRNGDYQLYAELFARLEDLFQSLRPLGILVPRNLHLLDRIEYLVFQIRTVAEIYRQSNLVPGIGGAIPFLAIAEQGIHTHGVRFV